MTNRIQSIRVETHSLDPAQAELRLTVFPDRVAPTTEVRGRLMGPRCPYSSTVEIAYPVRPLHRPSPEPQQIAVRVVIPEPSLWDPVSPFLYEGPVELWEDGERTDLVRLTHGLRRLSLARAASRQRQGVRAVRTGGELGHGGGAAILARRGDQSAGPRGRCRPGAVGKLAHRLGFLAWPRTEGGRPASPTHPACLDVPLRIVRAEQVAEAAATGGALLAEGRCAEGVRGVLGWFEPHAI